MFKNIIFVCAIFITSCNGFLSYAFNEAMKNYLFEINVGHNRQYDTYGQYGYLNSFSGKNPTRQEYDFIIVGSGPGGCVLANRLSEQHRWKILLLEAGEPETFVHKIPLFAAYFQSTASSWGYTAERNEGFCWGMDDQKCGLPRGKALGGGSAINYMIYNRGNQRDFNRWAEAGNYGWSYKEVLPYFLKSERANLRGKENSQYHNHTGPLSVEDVPYRSKLVRAFVKGSKQMGHQEIDYNGATQVGVSYTQANTFHGRRESAARAFIDPILGSRHNIHVLTSARVTKILINPKSKTAYGVEYVTNKRKYQVFCRKEVILSAGTFNSPQLLMLSGIGIKDQLNRINVPFIHELSVGRNMYDHMSHFGPTFTVNTTGQSLNANQIKIPQLKQFLNGHGILTAVGGVEALNFIKTPNSKEPSDFPDIELIFVPGSVASDQGSGLRNGLRMTQALYDKVYKPLDTKAVDHWSVMVMLFHPKSKGYLELKDNNPFHWPRFYPNYFEVEEDVETLLEGIKEAIRIASSPAMQKLGTRIHDIPLPNCAHLGFGTDDYWRCSIRTLSCTLHHQIGTCKMGPVGDPSAVVDPELRVHGINRLRIVDTSIIPNPPTSHTVAASYMIGEKAADMIKATWESQSS